MTSIQINKIRNRCWTAISPHTAAMAGDGMTVANIKQFIAGNFLPTPVQLSRLAHALGVQL